MKATYNEKTGKFNLNYLDPLKAFNGDLRPYSRKQITWTGEKKPTKKEINKIINELLEYGKQQEEIALLEVEKLKKEYAISVNGELRSASTNNINEPVNAVKYLINFDYSRLTKSRNKKTLAMVERIVIRFKDFLKTKYPHIALDKIKREIFKEFFNDFSDFAFDYQRKYFSYLNVLWAKILIDFEESEIKYVNHLEKYGISEYLTENPVIKKLPFTTEQVKRILKKAVEMKTEKNKDHAFQKFFILYFLIVTGWRIGDVLKLKWDQINFDSYTIKLMHEKTKEKTAYESIIFITPIMKEILLLQKENGKNSKFNRDYVFNLRTQTGETRLMEAYSESIFEIIEAALTESKELEKRTLKSGYELHNYTNHCLRKFAINELHQADFNSRKIHYLVGHEDNTMEGKHYIDFKTYPEKSTRALIEYLEALTNIRAFLNQLIYSEDFANSSYFGLNSVSEDFFKTLENNFWNEEAISIIRMKIDQGQRLTDIYNFIQEVNKFRLKIGFRDVSKLLLDIYKKALNQICE